MKKHSYFSSVVTTILGISLLFIACSKKESFTPSLVTEKVHILNHRSYQTSGAKNAILFIGDGMGLAQIHAAAVVHKGHLNMLQTDTLGFVQTQPANDFVTDSAAAATAIATGVSTRNSCVGVDPGNKPLTTIFDLAQKKGLSTGIVVTAVAVDATPAAFYAHNINRNDYESIAADFVASPPDVFIGGGRKYFTNRKDNRDLLKELSRKGYQVVMNFPSLEAVSEGKVAAFLYEGKPPKMSQGRGDFLSLAVKKAISLLSRNPKGFLLMVEGSQIDSAEHDRDLPYMLNEVLDLDAAVGTGLFFADEEEKTLIVITADHETGGLTLNSGSEEKGQIDGRFNLDSHTGIMVPIFAWGPGAERFQGIFRNTQIFAKLKEALGI